MHTHATSQSEDHTQHQWEPTETIYDNPAEYTRWAYCNTCKCEFFEFSSELCDDENCTLTETD